MAPPREWPQIRTRAPTPTARSCSHSKHASLTHSQPLRKPSCTSVPTGTALPRGRTSPSMATGYRSALRFVQLASWRAPSSSLNTEPRKPSSASPGFTTLPMVRTFCSLCHATSSHSTSACAGGFAYVASAKPNAWSSSALPAAERRRGPRASSDSGGSDSPGSARSKAPARMPAPATAAVVAAMPAGLLHVWRRLPRARGKLARGFIFSSF
eukprot:3547044-Prymnesium_polylepis.1